MGYGYISNDVYCKKYNLSNVYCKK